MFVWIYISIENGVEEHTINFNIDYLRKMKMGKESRKIVFDFYLYFVYLL